jgi:16S rRNA G966 N2-methylase RsmD
VERDRAAIAAIEANLARTHLAGSARVVRSEAVGWLRAQAAPVHPWDIVVLDPPYSEAALLARSLELLGDGALGLVAPGGRVVAKHFWRETPPAVVGLLASERERRFGETALTFYRRQEDE